MISITYVSSAAADYNRTALLRLLEICRSNNDRTGITGILLFKDGAFLQVIEGPDREVRRLFQSIQNDSRHFAVVKLIEEATAKREYPEWSMAFCNLDTVDVKNVPAYAEFAPLALTDAAFVSDPALAHRLVRIFRERL